MFRLVRCRMNGVGVCREVGALLGSGAEVLSVAAEPVHHAHHAVMLAVPAAAWGKIRVGVGAKERRNQHPAEHHQQRNCDGAPHSQANSVTQDSDLAFRAMSQYAPMFPLKPHLLFIPSQRLE